MVALGGRRRHGDGRRAPTRRTRRCPGIDGPGQPGLAALDALEAAVGRPLPLRGATSTSASRRRPGSAAGRATPAAALVGADRLYGLGLDDERARARRRRGSARTSRSSCAAGAQWAEGRGERLRPASAPTVRGGARAKAPAGLSTAAVYAAFDRLPAPPRRPDESSRRPGAAGARGLGPQRPLAGGPRAAARPSGAAARALRPPGPARCSCAAAGRAWPGCSRTASGPRPARPAWPGPLTRSR